MKFQQKRGQFTITEKQIKRLLNGADRFRDRVVIKFLAYCGLRRFEVIQIKIQDIDFKRSRITVIGKGCKQRIVPVPPELITDVKFLIGKRKPLYLFESDRRNGPLSLKTINSIVAKAAKKSKVKNPDPNRKNLNPHLLRHSFARICKNKGLSIEVIQSLLGHAYFQSTMDQYGLLSMKEIHDRVRSAFNY